jgi:hypothetical protein
VSSRAFSAVDVKRAVRSLEAVGKSVSAVDFLPGGGFRILTTDAFTVGPSPAVEEPNPLQRIFGQ